MMRWRRGFFRLWVVLSLMWVAGISWVNTSDYRSYHNVSEQYILPSEFGLVPHWCGLHGIPSEDKSDWSEFPLASEPPTWAQSPANGTVPCMPPPTLWGSLNVWLTLAPTAILLAIGYTIAWIIRGFARE